MIKARSEDGDRPMEDIRETVTRTRVLSWRSSNAKNNVCHLTAIFRKVTTMFIGELTHVDSKWKSSFL